MDMEPCVVDITSIPFEIIENILEREELSFNDVCSFSKTCNKFYQLVHKFGNKIWKSKFRQTWPELTNHQDFKQHKISSWLHEFQKRLEIGRKTMNLVLAMSPRHAKQEELSPTDFVQFDQLAVEANHEMAIRFMIDELMKCVRHPDKNKNLTNKYYSTKVLRHLRQIIVKKQWENFKQLDPEEQTMEKGAVIVAQWSQPTEEITDESVGSEFDHIAEQVLHLLLLEHGEKHPSQALTPALRERWRTLNIADNHYTPYVSRQVLAAVSTVLFKQLGFYGNSELYYCQENSCINKVLELRRGIPITLAILFESIARRVGIKCEAIGFPGHFLLRWRDTYKEDVQYQSFYIDVFNKGMFLTRDSCPKFANSAGQCPMAAMTFKYQPSDAITVVERIANNLEVAGRQRDLLNGRSARLRSALELLYMIRPTNLNCLLLLARFYMQHNLDVKLLRQAVEQEMQVGTFDLRDLGQASYILRTLTDYDINYMQQNRENEMCVRRREGLHVEWAVGMVMRHKRYDYTCVIVGWDPTCVASAEWINSMNVHRLQRQANQPFYHVLVNDGTNRYAAEENLILEPSANRCNIGHCEIGRYFDEFSGLHFRPNAELARMYPDDSAVVNRTLDLQ